MRQVKDKGFPDSTLDEIPILRHRRNIPVKEDWSFPLFKCRTDSHYHIETLVKENQECKIYIHKKEHTDNMQGVLTLS